MSISSLKLFVSNTIIVCHSQITIIDLIKFQLTLLKELTSVIETNICIGRVNHFLKFICFYNTNIIKYHFKSNTGIINLLSNDCNNVVIDSIKNSPNKQEIHLIGISFFNEGINMKVVI